MSSRRPARELGHSPDLVPIHKLVPIVPPQEEVNPAVKASSQQIDELLGVLAQGEVDSNIPPQLAGAMRQRIERLRAAGAINNEVLNTLVTEVGYMGSTVWNEERIATQLANLAEDVGSSETPRPIYENAQVMLARAGEIVKMLEIKGDLVSARWFLEAFMVAFDSSDVSEMQRLLNMGDVFANRLEGFCNISATVKQGYLSENNFITTAGEQVTITQIVTDGEGLTMAHITKGNGQQMIVPLYHLM